MCDVKPFFCNNSLLRFLLCVNALQEVALGAFLGWMMQTEINNFHLLASADFIAVR